MAIGDFCRLATTLAGRLLKKWLCCASGVSSNAAGLSFELKLPRRANTVSRQQSVCCSRFDASGLPGWRNSTTASRALIVFSLSCERQHAHTSPGCGLGQAVAMMLPPQVAAEQDLSQASL